VTVWSLFFLGASGFLWVGVAGCGARTCSIALSGRPATAIHEQGAAGHGLNARAETKEETRAVENRQYHFTPIIVIGFVGGFVRHTDAVHSPVQVAERIRESYPSYPSGVYVEVFENRRREDAHRKILQILWKTVDGKLSDKAKQQARVIIYGMSWGGSETVALARELKVEKIPVLLTVQVDSVAKMGQNDQVIPANVAEAANFYQTDGLLHGTAEIRAEERGHTRILGNFHYEYKKKSLSCDKYPWYDRMFTKYHTEIECDPEVWNRVEALIRERLLSSQEDRSVSEGGTGLTTGRIGDFELATFGGGASNREMRQQARQGQCQRKRQRTGA
jgi:hypothetical protein